VPEYIVVAGFIILTFLSPALSKAFAPNDVILLGIAILARLVQPANVPCCIVEIPLPILTSYKLVHPLKAKAPKLVSKEGSTIFLRLLHPEKADELMLVSEDGSDIDSSKEQF
jgi:hypothetical protein